MDGEPRVAIDVTPLAGQPTGIAQSVHGLLGGLGDVAPEIVLVPYVLSTRARGLRDSLPADTTVVPGAAALVKLWSHGDRPAFDRFIGGADVLHATNFLVPPVRVATVVTIHDCSIVRHRHLCSPAVRAVEPSLRRALRRGAHVHVPSEFVASEVRELFANDLRADARVRVIPWGIPPLSAPAARSDVIPAARFVLALGTLEPRKNHAHLVAAFGRLAARTADVELVLAGPDGPARPDIEQAISRLPADVAARVHLTGAVDDDVRSALLAHAAIVAYPSIYEGFGFPVLEAMQCGTPVLAARAGAITEVAGDAALLVEPTDEPAMADALARLLDDDALRADLVARGRARVGQYSWTRCAAAMADLYRSIAR